MTTQPRSHEVRLYELVLENGRSASPFVWRIRYALAHKGIAYESVPLGIIEIPNGQRQLKLSGALPRLIGY